MHTPRHPHSYWSLVTRLLPAIAAVWLIGCQSTPPRPERAPTERAVRITQQVGGTHYRMLVHEGVWYQTFGTDLLVLEPRSGRSIRKVSLGRVGEVGPATDLAITDERMYIVLDRDEVVELSLSEPRNPWVLERYPAQTLGIEPQRLSVVNDEAYVSGRGGVVRLRDQRRIFSHPEQAGPVVDSDEGLVTTVGRRIHRLDDGEFVGSASELIPTALSRVPEGTLAFIRTSSAGAIVGLMGPNLRELDTHHLTVAVRGKVRSVRTFGNRLWVVSDDQVLCYAVQDDRLVRVRDVDVLGAMDVAPSAGDYLALAGTFGRTIYRIRSTSGGPGDTFLHTQREPSRLLNARSDGRHIVAGSEEGVWLYRIGSTVRLTDEPYDEPGDSMITRASSLDAEAEIIEDGRALSITRDGRTIIHREPNDAVMSVIVPIDGEFWVGHDDGITVISARIEIEAKLQQGVTEGDLASARLRIDGPVTALFPLMVDDGVAFVSTYGGFGTAAYVRERARSN
ncbi:MAG: hypothetical protein EA377_12870 [Phycisphaerales bacterium]|nr:MAG: hypothetical protein EA377_12870 [Phycisphaerales bacterium]